MRKFVLLLVLASPLSAAAAPENPASAPASDDADRRPVLAAMRQSFADLDDPDATVREQARVKLMGMERRDLPAFQAIVQESRPLTPAQAVVLRELVIHVYLAGEPYDTTGTQGFLGVRMQDTSVRIPNPNRLQGDKDKGKENDKDRDGEPDREHEFQRSMPAMGVVIVERMPGFVGARMLLDGDVILGVAEKPTVRMLGVFEFQAVVQSFTPGQTVTFEVLRQGQVTRVPVTLDAKPFESDLNALLRLIAERRLKAEAYWERSFGGLVNGSVG